MHSTPHHGQTTPVVVAVAIASSLVTTSALWAISSVFTSPPVEAAVASGSDAELRATVERMNDRFEVMNRKIDAVASRDWQPLRESSAGVEKGPGDPELPGNQLTRKKAKTADKGEGEGRSDYWAARKELDNLTDPNARRDLAHELLGSEQFWVRADAIQELLEHDPATAVPAIHQLVADASDQEKGPYAANRAVDALGDLEGYPVTNDLYRIYEENDVKGVDVAAARALERHGDDTLMLREVDQIRAGLAGDDHEARLRSIDSLGRTRSRTAVPHLLPLLGSDDVQTRLRAVRSLGGTGGVREIAALEAMLDDPVAAVRDRAVEALDALRRRVGR